MSWEETDIGEKRKTDCAEFVTRDRKYYMYRDRDTRSEILMNVFLSENGKDPQVMIE